MMEAFAEPIRVAGALTWSAAGRAHPRSAYLGDMHLVTSFEGGAMIAVVDGVGHGEDAHRAAAAAIGALGQVLPDVSLLDCLASVHEACRRTRGAALSVARVFVSTEERLLMEWGGIGNVEGVLVHAGPRGVTRRRLVSTNGVAGYRFDRARTTRVALAPGDMIAFATDGVDPRFADDLTPFGPLDDTCKHLLHQHGRPHDDALVLLARIGREAP